VTVAHNKNTMKIEISLALPSDAPAILSLQHRAFQSEAKRYNNFEIEPLKQTLEEIKKDFNDYIFLNAVYKNRIVGSVKLRKVENKCWVGRLIVEPVLRRKGIGTKLLMESENIVPDVVEYFLCTGSESEDNINFYRKSGYIPNGNDTEDKGIKLIGMSKPNNKTLLQPGVK
jgi:predicted N-acetyltransferase YhbS